MKYGLCHLSIVPVRKETSDMSELVTQLLYGDIFKITEQRKNWCKVCIEFDQYEGWIDCKQFVEITSGQFHLIAESTPKIVTDLVEYITDSNNHLQAITLGSVINGLDVLEHHYEGNFTEGILKKEEIVKTALLYLNSPYLWGGKTPFGIDCSGFTQMVYKINGYKLQRDATQQAAQGDTLSFIEECEPGDLAFFDNQEGKITHVGIVLQNHNIIHAHGCVRIDHLDHTGIFNSQLQKHTHKLRVLKKIV